MTVIGFLFVKHTFDDFFAGLCADSIFDGAVDTGVSFKDSNVDIFTLVFQIGSITVESIDSGSQGFFDADIHFSN